MESVLEAPADTSIQAADKGQLELAQPGSGPHSRAEHVAAGRAVRLRVPRTSHAEWNASAKKRDPIAILEASNQGRLQELVPIRFGRMLRSPFTFLRGSAALMAHDLATGPNSGFQVQACGDCHLMNFGLFATPERNLVFDLNDFDETLPAPWEWDVKRLAVSFAVAARERGLADAQAEAISMTCVRSYREHLRDYSTMSPLEVWYARLDMASVIAMAPDEKSKKIRRQLEANARKRVIENLFPKITDATAGGHRLVDQPPILYHVAEPDVEERIREGLEDYRLSLSD